MSDTPKYWAIIPAAGSGTRMRSDIPKQYLKLSGLPVIEQAVSCLLDHPKIQKTVVVLSEDDSYWPTLSIANSHKIITTTGGNTRCESVLNGLSALNKFAKENDWVLVHDAVRPYLKAQDLDNLINQLNDHPVGGLLATPVRDTLKKVDAEQNIIQTISRHNLWHAQTPQMFRFQKLTNALKQIKDQHKTVTDEAEAIELSGEHPKIITGDSNNIKITHPEDIKVTEHV